MKVYLGIDLGSTTTKAVLITESGSVLGRGITNSRSNYEVASRIAGEEAFVQARFELTRRALAETPALERIRDPFLARLERTFRRRHHLDQLDRLAAALEEAADAPRHASYRVELGQALELLNEGMRRRALEHFKPLALRRSEFFRDLATADFMHLAERKADPRGIRFELLSSLFDQAILPVENSTGETPLEDLIRDSLDEVLEDAATETGEAAKSLRDAVRTARAVDFEVAGTAGTGYGRARLPFERDQIRSEILCHGLGAHTLFPRTRTVLDIGGQDTKAIQVDGRGIVTSFQMNDRCAAGCGRYLGYIADEMNLGVHELGPLAQQATCRVKINSTCTVFAGAELRERLSLGQRREDILAGLHRAIVLRAMSLLARSGGIEEQFTFTGGVANNPAAVAALTELVQENYGERTLNISPDSIYTGALGASLFALRGLRKAA